MLTQIREYFDGIVFTREQRRGILVIFGLFLGVGTLLYFLAQGSASAVDLQKTSTPIALPSGPITPELLIVDVAGKVRHPGVYSLPKGARAIDAIKAAGNKLNGVDTSDINLAHILFDGEQIVVGAPRYVATSKGSKSSPPKRTGPVSINNGGQADLESLPGIGPVMASRIITYRKSNGPFPTLEELKKVKGMGEATYAEISSLIRL
jgi:competence protein ComEA